jgi:hypothetical protein
LKGLAIVCSVVCSVVCEAVCAEGKAVATVQLEGLVVVCAAHGS